MTALRNCEPETPVECAPYSQAPNAHCLASESPVQPSTPNFVISNISNVENY